MSTNTMRNFNMLKMIHDVRVHRAEEALRHEKRKYQETLDNKGKKEEDVENEELRFTHIQQQMQEVFQGNLIRRDDIEYWRSMLAKQQEHIKQAQVALREAELQERAAFSELEHKRKQYASTVHRKDKIYYVSKELKKEVKRKEEKKEERELTER